MSSIDDRVVNMQFNNAQFQQGIGQTNDSLEQLKQNLNLDGATAGINGVQNAANRFSLANMESALDNISSKFSIFGAVGFTVIQNLTNSALDAGKNIANAIIDPLVNGGERRALAIQQAQFQFRGLGLDIDQTMAAAKAAVLGTQFGLDEAATAAAQLGASGINAGNGLQSVLRSIAGVAAQTGSSFSSVANIFETVAGNGRLMGENLLELSSRGVNAAAILAKTFHTTEGHVRDMVSDGKISFKQFSDAMNKAFGANAANANQLYTGSLANMNAALARIGADVQSEKLFALRDIFNALGPMFDKVHVAIMPLITAFNDLQAAASAKTVNIITNLLGPGVIASLQNVVQAILAIGRAIGGGFRRIFPDDAAAQMTSISVFLQKITAALIPSSHAAEELRRTFAGLFAIFDIAGQIIGSFIKTIFTLLGFTAPLGGSFLDITARIGDFIVKVDDAIKHGQVFQQFFRALGAIIAVPIAVLRTFFGILADGIDKITGLKPDTLNVFADDVNKHFAALNKLATLFNSFFAGVGRLVNKVWAVIKPTIVEIGKFIGEVADKVTAGLKTLTPDQGIKLIGDGLLGTFLFMVRGFFGNLGSLIRGNGIGIVTQVKQLLNTLRVNLKALEIETNAKSLETIAIALALLAASAFLLSTIDPDKLTVALSAMSAMVIGIIAAMKNFNKLEAPKATLKILAIAFALQVIAGAILTLTLAVALLGALPLANLVQGIIALTIVITLFVIALKAMKDIGPGVLAGAGAIAILAPGIAILAGAVSVLGAIPFINLIQGLGGFVVILGALIGTLALLDKIFDPVELLASAGAIAIIAGAMVPLTGAVAAFGALPFAKLLQGVVAFVVIIGTLVGALAILNLLIPEDVLIASIAIGLVASAMIPLIAAVVVLSKLPLTGVLQAVVTLAVVLAILVGAVALLGLFPEVSLVGAAAMVVIALAIAILAPALFLLSKLSWDAIGRLFVVLAGGLGILVIMGILLIPASVGFLLFAVALVLIGAAVNLAATGIGLLAIGIAALVAVGAGGIAIFGLALDAFIKKLPALGLGVGAAIVEMVVAIGAGAGKMLDAMIKLILVMIQAVDKTAPQLVQMAVTIITLIVTALTVLIPLLVDSGLQIINGILAGIDKNIGSITQHAINIITTFVNTIANNLSKIINAGGNLILNFINGMADYIHNNSTKFVTAGKKLFTAIVDGVSKAIEAGGTLLREAGGKIGLALLKGAEHALGIASPSKVFRFDFMPKLFDGITKGNEDNLHRADSAGSDIGDTLGNAAINSVKNAVAGISSAIDTNIDSSPTIRPVLDISDIQNKAKQINGLLPSPTLSLDTSSDVATSVALQEQDKNAVLSLQSDTDSKTGTTINYTQNNNSPKALSTPEVYRQTKNQLSTLKGELGVVEQSGSPQ